MKLSLERFFPFLSLLSLFSFFLFDGMVVNPSRRIVWLLLIAAFLLSDLLYRFASFKYRKEDNVRYFITFLGFLSFIAAVLREVIDVGYRSGLNQEASLIPKIRDFLLLVSVISAIAFLVQTIIVEVGKQSLEAQSDLSRTKTSLVQNAVLGLLLVLPVVVAANYFAILRNYNYDLSAKGKYSLSEVSRSILKTIDRDVLITAFYPRPLEADGPENSLALTRIRPDLEILLDQFKAVNPKITVQFINADIETDLLKDFGQVSNGLINVRSNKESLLDSDTPYLEEKIYVREPSDLEELERRLMTAIFTVATKEKKAYFTTSNGERYGAGFKNVPNERISKFVSGLQYLNFKVQELNFSNGWPSTIPEDADLVLIIGASVPFSLEAQTAILSYLKEKKGKVFVTIEPKGSETLDWLAKESGLKFVKSTLAEVNDKPGFIVAKTFSQTKSTDLIPKKDLGVVFPFSGYFETVSTGENPFSFKTENLLESGNNVFVDTNNNGKLDPTEKRENLLLSVTLSSLSLDDSKVGKVIFHSGTSWLTDQFFGYNMNSNFALATSTGLFLDSGISGIPAKKEDIQTVSLSENQKLMVWAFGVFLFPGLIIGIGSYYVSYRRRLSTV